MPAPAQTERWIRPGVLRLVLAAAFLLPPLAGLVLIERFFGGLGPGLWLMAGVVFLFAVTLVVGLARAERASPRPPR